uniref:Uncharacterized protein n=1 Tax=Pseudomonas putida TaxID=303 RepID=A0A223Q433_PSEPU|nr:Hypothetical protein [Pseudomonas putida]
MHRFGVHAKMGAKLPYRCVNLWKTEDANTTGVLERTAINDQPKRNEIAISFPVEKFHMASYVRLAVISDLGTDRPIGADIKN